MAKDKTKKSRPVVYILGAITQIVLILLLVSVAIAGFASRIPLLAQNGIRFFAVTSGSMEPTIPTGSLIYVSGYNEDDLTEGDVITYYSRPNDDENAQSAVVTHRITRVVKEETKQILTNPETGEDIEQVVLTHEFVTKGDANNTEDRRTVPVGNVIGVYQWHVPSIGYVTAFAQGPQGFLLLVILPGAILIIWEVISVVKHFKDEGDKKSQAELEKIKKELEAEKAKNTKTD